MNTLFDKYSLQGRFLPALIAMTPLAVAIVVWIPDVETALKPLILVVVGAGLAVPVAEAARDRGKKEEGRLVVAWGGLPSVRFLRHRDTNVEPVTKARYHKTLEKLVHGVRLPKAHEEERDSVAADQAYASCCGFLRSLVRDTAKYPVVFAENISYGFRRNVLGLRSIGVAVAVLATAAVVLKLWLEWSARRTPPPLDVIALALNLGLLTWFLCVVRDQWVEKSAERYAFRLLEVIDKLGSEPKGKS